MSNNTRQTYVRASPCVFVPDNATPLHIPHRSRDVPASAWCDYDRPVPPAWAELAARRGFRVDRRVRDRYHLALKCEACGSLTAVKVFALRDAAVRCGGCASRAREQNAQSTLMMARPTR